MGPIHCSTQEVELTVASLNFSGININPFQFNDGSPIFEQLNHNYQLIKNVQFPNLTKWVGAVLDKNYKTDRFTVLFGDELVNNLQSTLFTQERFSKIWTSYYYQAKTKGKIHDNYQASLEEESDVLRMDFSFYRAIVMTIYGYKSLEQYHKKADKQPSEKLKQFLQKSRNRPPFQLEVKKKLVEEYFLQTDVMFLQEAGSVDWLDTPGYTIIKNHDSVIAYRTEIFGQPDFNETERWKKSLDINQDTAIIMTNKAFLLVSAHLSSKQKLFKKETEELRSQLNKVINSYLLSEEMNLIIGIDANHWIESFKLDKNAWIVPVEGDQHTSIKKRSFIQAQLHKADVMINELKDHIISTLPITDFRIETIKGLESSKDILLPNDQHPYDHYVVNARVKIARQRRAC